jgi:hypothetical protein
LDNQDDLSTSLHEHGEPSLKASRYMLIAILAFVCLPTYADSLDQIATFAEKICHQSLSGGETSTTITANLNGDVNGLAKALGISVGAGGLVKHDGSHYAGIPADKLPKEIPTEAQCRADLAKSLIAERIRLATPPSRSSSPPPFLGGAGVGSTQLTTEPRIANVIPVAGTIQMTVMNPLEGDPTILLNDKDVSHYIYSQTPGQGHAIYVLRGTSDQLNMHPGHNHLSVRYASTTLHEQDLILSEDALRDHDRMALMLARGRR